MPFWKYNLHPLSSLTKTGGAKGPEPAPSPAHVRTNCSDGEHCGRTANRPCNNDHYFSVLYPLSAETSGAPSDIIL